ncbi:MAG TPA: hypothetical protein ENJ43_05560 [Gammaproteobacteria bacterium]|nr:hypothetical protein [Gammaproteobacteria bacterium]
MRRIYTPRNALIWICVALLLAGCEGMPQANPPSAATETVPAVVVEQDPRLTELLAYQAAVTRRPSEQVRQEYKRLDGLLIEGVCDELRLRVAMLLTSPALASKASAKRTSKLLQPCLSPGEHEPAFTSLAEILQRQLAEQRRTRVAVRHQLQLRERLEAAEARIGELNRKLDELKRIERSIRERQ